MVRAKNLVDFKVIPTQVAPSLRTLSRARNANKTQFWKCATCQLINVFLFPLPTDDIVSLNVCLGNFHHHYGKIGRNQICNQGGLLLKILCRSTFVGHMIIASNIPETFLLYYCYKAIQDQTEKSRQAIGKDSYLKRKR